MAKSKVTKASKPIQEPEIKEKKKYNYTVKTGRPTEYTTELAIEFCNRLIRSASVAEVCRADDMPDRSTIFLWKLQNKGGDFLDLYEQAQDRKSTRLNSSHGYISYAVFCLKKKNK